MDEHNNKVIECQNKFNKKEKKPKKKTEKDLFICHHKAKPLTSKKAKSKSKSKFKKGY